MYKLYTAGLSLNQVGHAFNTYDSTVLRRFTKRGWPTRPLKALPIGSPELTNKFLALVIPEPNSGCWFWLGYVNPSGYGQFNRRYKAHRISYQTFVGEIPPTLELDHLCRVRSCVNPKHLEPVTHRENVMRGDAPAAVARIHLSKTHCPLGHPLSGDNLRLRKNWRRCKECGRIEARRNRAKLRGGVNG